MVDIESGKVNLVITKDLSRLGRDYIQTGYYTEIHFVERGVRYIAINDNVDTIRADNDIAPFRNILNDMYSKDISRKVRSAMRQRALKGYFISPAAPYGYRKHPGNKNLLTVDPEAAETVKEIFRLALTGHGGRVIVKALTEKRVLIPSAYKTLQGVKGYTRYNKKGKADYDYKWKYRTVLQILRDSVYVGDIVNRKSETVSYKTGKTVAVPTDKRIVVKDMHEPIVTRDDFARVQELISARHTPRKHNHDNIFHGLLFCSDCGKRLTLFNQHIKVKGGGKVLKSSYRCANHFNNPDECAHYNYIYYEDLYAQMLVRVKKAVERITSGEVLKAVQERTDNQSGQDRLTSEKDKAEKRLNALSVIMRKLYEDYAAETLDCDNYKTMLAEYQCEQKALKERLTVIDGELGKENDVEGNFLKLKLVAASYAECSELTSEMLKQLIERIEISHPVKADGVTTQNISINYRFIQTNL